jgi:hypothetical protein
MPVAICRQNFLEPNHDACVPSPSSGLLTRVLGRQAMDERVDQIMLKGSGGLAMHEDIRPGLGQTTGLREQAREVRTGN